MLSEIKKRTKVLICSFLLLLIYVLNVFAGETQKDYIDHFQKLADLLNQGHNHEVDELVQKWSDFLYSRSSFSNEVYQSAIHELLVEYHEEISRYSGCIEKLNKVEKHVQSNLLDDLIERFGIGFVKKNEKVILMNFQAIVAGNVERGCGDVRQNLIYTEAKAHSAYKYYLELFNEFYETLNVEDQKKLQNMQNAAEIFSSLLAEGSFYRLSFAATKPVQKLTEIAARNHNRELYSFFVNHPVASQHFDLFKAVDDLHKITRAGQEAKNQTK